jgi:hypothetical protein
MMADRATHIARCASSGSPACFRHARVVLLWSGIIFVCGGLVLYPVAARAVPLVEKSAHYVVLDGSFKSFFFGLHMPRHPEVMLDFLEIRNDYGAMAIADVRLKLEGEHKMRWQWKLHLRSQPLTSTFPNAMSFMGTGGSARPARALPLQTMQPFADRFQWYHEVDRLQASVRLGKFTIILGRQPISLGVGFVWKPADLVGTFSPLEVDREYKPGVDALRVDWALGAFTELSLIGAAGGPACRDGSLPNGEPCHDYEPRFELDYSVALTRFRTTVGRFDLGALAGWVRGDVVGGVFATGTIKRFRIRSEAVVTYDVEEDRGAAGFGQSTYVGAGNPNDEDAVFVRAVLGADYQFDTKQKLFVLAELYYNGFGSHKTEDYADLMTRPRVQELGEVVNVGLLYAAVGVNWEPHYRVPLALTVMGNLLDPSLHISATATYKLGDNSILEGGAFIPVGRGPRFDENNLRLEIRSEFGFYPYVYYLAWKMYF